MNKIICKIVLVAMILMVSLATSASLKVTNGTATVEFTSEGNLVANVPQKSLATVSGAFVLSKSSVKKFQVDNQAVRFDGTVSENLITSGQSGDLVFKGATATAVAVISGTTADLAVGGDNLLPGASFVMTSAVAYAGDEVFVHDPATSKMKLDYQNVGDDGKVVYTASLTTEGHYFYAKDHLGSTRAVISNDANVVQALDYTPYGAVVSLLDSDNKPLEAREKFTGKEWDNEGYVNGAGGINLVYFGKRYYDLETGIFTSVDPKDVFWNSYSYCGGNPVVIIDPNGEFPFVLIGMVLLGAYIGGSMGQDWTSIGHPEFNPAKWKWDEGGTYGGIALGAATGYLFGGGTIPGFMSSATIGINTPFGILGPQVVTSNTILAYGLGIAGYAGGAAMLFGVYQEARGPLKDYIESFDSDKDLQREDPADPFVHKKVADNWQQLPPYVRNFQPVDVYGQNSYNRGDHMNNLRLPGYEGYHITEEYDPRHQGVWVHQDKYNASANPLWLIYHLIKEARRKPKVESCFYPDCD